MVSNWSEEEVECALCEENACTIQHIHAECWAKVALGKERYRWWRDKILKQISEQVGFYCELRVNA